MPKRMVTDWRNPVRWTKAERARKCSRASVSNVWTTNPFGISGTETLVAVQPGVLLYNGIPTGAPDSFNARLGNLAADNGWHILNGEKPVSLWRSGAQSVAAIDLARDDVARAFAYLIREQFNWAAGVHLDYFTDLAWIDNSFPRSYWDAWNQGWREVCAQLRLGRPGFKILAQQFHLTPITDAADGLFLEESPGHFGLTFDQIAENMKRHGRPAEWVLELRNPGLFPSSYVRQVEGFADGVGCYVSFGRDATAWSENYA